MKKILIGILILMMCFGVAACGAQEVHPVTEPIPAVEPTPEPTPEPAKIIAIVTDAEQAELFMSGADTVLAESGYELQSGSLADYADTDAVAVVAYLTQENADTAQLAAAAARGAKVAVYDAGGTNAVEGAMYFDYDASAERQMLMEQAYVYPLHDTPVRMFGVFTSAQSEAYGVWAKGCEEGKIFPKAVYIDEEQTELSETEWLNEQLTGFFPGMLDCMYTEDETLGMEAAQVMETLGRDDAEVFIGGASEELIAKMRSNPRLYGMTVGQNLCYAGAYTAAAAVKALDGTVTENMTFLPTVIYAEDIAAGDEGFFTDAMKQAYPY